MRLEQTYKKQSQSQSPVNFKLDLKYAVWRGAFQILSSTSIIYYKNCTSVHKS